MIKQFVQKMTILPSWVILLFDLCCVVLAVTLAIIIRTSFGANLPNLSIHEIYNSYLYILVIRTLLFIIFGTQKMVVRYTNSKNLLNIIFACIIATLILYGSNIFVNKILHLKHFVPMSVIFMELTITLVLLIFYRIQFKTYYLETINPSKFKKNIVIFGAGDRKSVV